MKNSIFWRAMVDAWSLAFDAALPRSLQPDKAEEHAPRVPVPPEFGVYCLPLWGALWALLAWLLSRILLALIPAVGGAVLFAVLLTVASEWRTSSRGLALTVSTGEGLLSGENWPIAVAGRQSAIRKLSGPYANILVMVMLAAKFFALFQCYSAGYPAFAGMALVIALTIEGIMAVQPPYEGGAPLVSGGATPHAVLWIGGFVLLFNFIYLPLLTLIAAGVAGLAVWMFTAERQRNAGRLFSDDMTLAGYASEMIALLFALLLLR